jgi:hypothetical protein|tara:strand:+ start:1029 stop:1238 length:210 start_codon:yes stop_codon:yes gene_type:complete
VKQNGLFNSIRNNKQRKYNMYLKQPEGATTPIIEEIENLIINAVDNKELTIQEIREAVEDLLLNLWLQQ